MNTKPQTLTRRVHFMAKPADVEKWQGAADSTKPKPIDLSEWIRNRLNPTPAYRQGQPYSKDRLSLAQEIRDTLSSRGYWVPDDWAGADLITAVGMALDKSTTHSPDF